MSEEIESGASVISQFAVVVSPKDNLAVVKNEILPGTCVILEDGRVVRVTERISPGHRFATRAIPAGEFVLQYGHPIGTSLGVGEGDLISHANMTDDIPVVRDLPAELHTPPPDYTPVEERATFSGYRRADGRV